MRGLLGESLLASDRLRFDLFREATTQTMVPIAFARRPLVILHGGEWFVEAGWID